MHAEIKNAIAQTISRSDRFLTSNRDRTLHLNQACDLSMHIPLTIFGVAD
ncbi:MAG: hypothetical protein MJA27_20725 [Pseudanabaenales cyanobacterium]|nr:hypothetical protein [Pseudanabaenales cyanobacterium]